MSNKARDENLDDLLDLLSKPLSRYILSVLAGVDPGAFHESVESSVHSQDEK
jgi:hypothetical protein